METMQEPVHDRCEYDPCNEDNRQAAVYRVKTGKKLASVGLEGLQRSHAG